MTARPVAQSLFPDYVADKPVGPLPLSVQTGTNADLMWAIRDLYLTGSVLDVTYGEGKWWDRYQPDPFTAHDLYKLDGVDFRALPEADRSIDTVCFDPPYIPDTGGQFSTVPGFLSDYGIGRCPESDLWLSIQGGLTECARIARQWVLVKCMEFIKSGQFHVWPQNIQTHGVTLGLATHDVIVHNTGTGPGGHNIWEAKRCRRAHSYLLVFAVPS